jgi:hypothetical protein
MGLAISIGGFAVAKVGYCKAVVKKGSLLCH